MYPGVSRGIRKNILKSSVSLFLALSAQASLTRPQPTCWLCMSPLSPCTSSHRPFAAASSTWELKRGLCGCMCVLPASCHTHRHGHLHTETRTRILTTPVVAHTAPFVCSAGNLSKHSTPQVIYKACSRLCNGHM